jgi:DNA modification methylase
MQTWRVMVGDVREQLRLLPDASVQCVVTSPPYWGLRDYGVSGQIGLEHTPYEYVEALVDVFTHLWRVLAPDGVLWLNLGDSYANDEKWGGSSSGKHVQALHGDTGIGRGRRDTGLKPKDLVGVPWRVAFALQAAGWWLRSDVIWSKPNPMPESVTDRPTKSHEYIFMLTKSERYFYDAEAIAEPASSAMLQQMDQGYDGLGIKDYESAGVQNPSSVKARIIANARRKSDSLGVNGRNVQATNSEASRRDEIGAFNNNPALRGAVTRNARSVWTITTQAYPDAHFATFPEAIPERCIKAGSRVGDLVLDPFCGSGTTGQVALRLGRCFVGVELNPQYAELARKRIGGAAPLFASEADATVTEKGYGHGV